ncbi:MAG: hypothetical protein R2771_14125 [Saprospiraceae bacterium]
MILFKNFNTIIKEKEIEQSEFSGYSISEYDITEINKSIQDLFENFKEHKLKELVKIEPEVYNLYFNKDNREKKDFPILMKFLSLYSLNPHLVTVNEHFLKEYPYLKNSLDEEIIKLNQAIYEIWYQGLKNIGYLDD